MKSFLNDRKFFLTISQKPLIIDFNNLFKTFILNNNFNLDSLKLIFNNFNTTNFFFKSFYKTSNYLNLTSSSIFFFKTLSFEYNRYVFFNFYKNLNFKNQVWNKFNIFSLDSLNLNSLNFKFYRDLNLLTKYEELFDLDRRGNMFFENLQQYRWMYKYSLLHRNVFKNLTNLNINILWLDSNFTKTSLKNNLIFSNIYESLNFINKSSKNLKNNYLNHLVNSYSWVIKRNYLFSNLNSQLLNLNFKKPLNFSEFSYSLNKTINFLNTFEFNLFFKVLNPSFNYVFLTINQFNVFKPFFFLKKHSFHKINVFNDLFSTKF